MRLLRHHVHVQGVGVMTHPFRPDDLGVACLDCYAFENDPLHVPEQRAQGSVVTTLVIPSAPNEEQEDQERAAYGEPFVRTVPPPSNPMAVARKFVNLHYQHQRGLLLRHHRGLFYSWDGTRWVEGEDRKVRSALYGWLENTVYLKDGLVPTPFEPTRMKMANVVEALQAIVHLDAATEPPAWINGAADLPATEVVSMANGLLHVPTRTLLPHTPAFFVRHSLPFDYDAAAPPPERWLTFLEELWGEDQTSVDALQEVMGYVIGGDTRQQKISLFVGPRRGGKGTIGRVLTGLLGRHNVAAPTLAGLVSNFGLQDLIDRPLALVSDARLGSKADSSVAVERLLSISGEDSITVDRKYRDPWTGRLPSRFVILTNEIPRLLDASGALASRFVLLVLTKSFLGRENPKLTDELLEEAPGILNWALEGLDRLKERGHFQMPESSREALVQLEDLSSPVAAFVRDRCEQGPEHSTPVDEMWSAWKDWCTDDNRHPGTKATFGRDLKATCPAVHKVRRADDDQHRWHEYVGIAVGSTTESHGDFRDVARPRHSSHGDVALYPQHEDGSEVCQASADA